MQCPPGQFAVVDLEQFTFEPHCLGEQAEYIVVRFGFAERRDRRLIGLDVEVSVGIVDVEVLELCCGRQHDIGIVRGIGLKLFVNDGEEIFAHQSLEHPRLIGANRGGI